MSDSSDTPDTPTSADGADVPDHGLIPDEQLPEDLQPEKNPLAADPADTPEDQTGPRPDA